MNLRATPLERRTPMRRTPFAPRRRPIKQARTLPETPTKRHPHPGGPTREIVRLVLLRATRDESTTCEVCGAQLFGARGYDWSIHHRRGRDGRADSHAAQNLLIVCGASNVDGCHGRIHQRRSWSRPLGYWLSRTAGTDPLTVPVAVHDGLRWFTAAGTYAPECAR